MTELNEYDYDLPRELIAQYALSRRSDARMMVVNRSERTVEHAHVRDLPGYVGPEDCLVLNNTRVLPARLRGYRVRTRGRWSGLYLASDTRGLWQVLATTRGKPRVGEQIQLQDRFGNDRFCLTLTAQLGEGIWAARPDRSGSALELLEQVGRVPLPPYIRNGDMEDRDLDSYQTVYARCPGAIAAPTAGLHFTPELLAELVRAGTGTCYVTLHVGVGTFRPISVGRVEDHRMHLEWGEITGEVVRTLQSRREGGGRIIAVGTTSVRVLETAARDGTLRPWCGETDLFIRPPHAFQAVDALLTNFHLPKSTLLILVRAFGGESLIRDAYDAAIAQRYRFYSYGDAMLIV
jgi:S-adenosylmethionine:tRNA ribosyltransferase-isomerase